eukprot:scaffold53827_cov28-Tisochrysis_lutea.AAC.3
MVPPPAAATRVLSGRRIASVPPHNAPVNRVEASGQQQRASERSLRALVAKPAIVWPAREFRMRASPFPRRETNRCRRDG